MGVYDVCGFIYVRVNLLSKLFTAIMISRVQDVFGFKRMIDLAVNFLPCGINIV